MLPGSGPRNSSPQHSAGGFGTTAYVFALLPAVHLFAHSFIVLSAYYVLGPGQTLGGVRTE